MKSKFRKNKNEPVLIDSLTLNENISTKSENRIFTLLLKSLIIYLITAGLIGSALTATNTYFNQFVFNAVILCLSLLLGLIYYNKLTENIGDILYLFLIIIFGISYGAYVNSGFYAWMNDIIGTASVYFDLNDIGGYNQIISNSDLTVTIASCYLGAIIAIIITISLMKKMMYADLLLDAVFILIFPLYFGLEPNFVYFSMIIAGIIFSSIWKNSGKYQKYDKNNSYAVEKKNITYVYSYKAHLFSFIQIIIPVIIILLAIYIAIPKNLYNLTNNKSNIKENSDDFVETLIISGIAGFFNRYDNTGGMSSGKLGGVNSVNFDYSSDLKITYVPFNFEPVYIRTFIGGTYQPYENEWYRAEEKYLNRYEYEKLKEKYLYNETFSSKGKMVIQNIAAETGEYALYYSHKDSLIHRNETAERIFYPYTKEMGTISQMSLSPEEKRYWLDVSKDNFPSLYNTLNKLNIPENASSIEKAEIIRQYFVDNIPYNLRAGITPYRKDFVNYFLDKQKKGYCVHFASAGALMLRSLGIPARYVEGYVYDYSDTSSLIKETSLDKEDFYKGYNKVENSSLISVELTDANAHAWIEIFIDGIGWTPFEFTPPSSDNSFTNRTGMFDFMDLFNFNPVTENTTVNAGNLQFNTASVRRVVCIILIICIIIILVPVIAIFAYNTHKYYTADINTKLTLQYHYFIRRISRKNSSINNKYNYKDVLLSVDYPDKDKIDKCIFILEKAGFSNKVITIEEFEYCKSILKSIKR